MLSSASEVTASEPHCQFPKIMVKCLSLWALPLPYLYLQQPHLLPRRSSLRASGSMLPAQPHFSESCLLRRGQTLSSSMSTPTPSPREKPSSSPRADSSAQASPRLEVNLSFSWDHPVAGHKLCKECGRPTSECDPYLHRPPLHECAICNKQFYKKTRG